MISWFPTDNINAFKIWLGLIIIILSFYFLSRPYLLIEPRSCLKESEEILVEIDGLDGYHDILMSKIEDSQMDEGVMTEECGKYWGDKEKRENLEEKFERQYARDVVECKKLAKKQNEKRKQFMISLGLIGFGFAFCLNGYLGWQRKEEEGQRPKRKRKRKK